MSVTLPADAGTTTVPEAAALPDALAAAPSPPKTPRLASEDELWLRRDADPAAREELIRRHLGFACKLASRYRSATEPYDDLKQVAQLALLKAVDRYDPLRGIPFTGFATPTILGELKRHFRDRTWAVRLPRGTHDLLMEVEKATARLTVELQRSPSVAEIAERLAVDPTDVLEALDADGNRKPLSFDMGTDDNEEGSTFGELVGTDDAGFELSEERFAIEQAISVLDDRERELLRLRFEEDMTQSEIAAIFGVSQMQISRLLRRALTKIREGIGEAELDAAPIL